MFGLTLPQSVVVTGLILVFAELVVGIEAGLDLVAIGSILLLSGFLGTVSNINVTLITASVLVVAYFILGRKMIKSRLVFTTKKTNVDKLIGKTGVVVRSITPDTPGLVRLDDEDWRATAEMTLFEKDKVAVESIEGVTLKVTKKG